MIEARGLVKRYGSALAVDHLSFTIRPGLVTGFLGPNGAGKTTTMRGDHRGVRVPVPAAAACQGAAQYLVHGRGAVAARW
jgi:ABC-type phosphonate transport system ATPase subunit